MSDDSGYVVADQSSTFVGSDGVMYQAVYVPVNGWPDASEAGDAGAYYSGAQMEQDYTQWLEPVQQGHLVLEPGNVWKMAKDSQGCRFVQEAFDNASNDEERMALTAELKGHVWEALKCQNANHVMQKCISVIRPLSAQFVIDELMARGPGGAAQAARHRFGCRIIERLLEHCSLEQVSPLVQDLLTDAVAMSTHIYGNYVVSHLLEHCGPEVVLQITASLQKHVSTMPADGYAGTVIGKALSHASKESARSLALSVLQDPERLTVMACSRWGHQAVKQALQLADAPERQKACAELSWRSNRLRSSRYGRLVATFAAEQQKQM
jgi:pumilio RNA-binding family